MSYLEKLVLPALTCMIGILGGFLGALYLQKRQHKREDEKEAMRHRAQEEARRQATKPNEIQWDILRTCFDVGGDRFTARFTSGVPSINGHPIGNYDCGIIKTQLVNLAPKGLIEILDRREYDIVFQLTDTGKTMRVAG